VLALVRPRSATAATHSTARARGWSCGGDDGERRRGPPCARLRRSSGCRT